MTRHRHKDSRALWTTYVTDPDLSGYVTKANLASATLVLQSLIDALAARVALLEPPPVEPPPVEPPPAVPVVISGVSVGDISTTTARVTWTVSEPATGQVEYGTTDAYGKLSALEASYTYTTHVQTLSGLTPGTTHHFRTHSTVADGRGAYSADGTFSTLGTVPDPPPPPPPPATSAIFQPDVFSPAVFATK